MFVVLTWIGVYASRCNEHVQTLRRLAQNREAARKSRLRKKVSESTSDDLHQDWNKKDEKKN